MIFVASTSSANLRPSVASSSPVDFLMYCWVIPDPPPTPVRNARPMPVGSKPWLSQKVGSSVAMMASRSFAGTRE
ncbi:hypothetical protein DV26_14120 [Amycolatopsis mediterranei]|nr:hypothetical protein DV26_14120 [Amycolatopsis mediterranei]KDU92720.1 hypothetical protein DV36_07980 [Amycolatopsis mediterranei]